MSFDNTGLYCHGCGKLLSSDTWGTGRTNYKPEDDCGVCKAHRLIDSGFTFAEMEVLKNSPEYMKARENKMVSPSLSVLSYAQTVSTCAPQGKYITKQQVQDVLDKRISGFEFIKPIIIVDLFGD